MRLRGSASPAAILATTRATEFDGLLLFDIETRRFREPLERYRFPMTAGTSWNQHVDNYNEYTQRAGPISRGRRR